MRHGLQPAGGVFPAGVTARQTAAAPSVNAQWKHSETVSCQGSGTWFSGREQRVVGSILPGGTIELFFFTTVLCCQSFCHLYFILIFVMPQKKIVGFFVVVGFVCCYLERVAQVAAPGFLSC